MRRDLGQAIARFWKGTTDTPIIGVGFALPYLRQWLKPSSHVLSIMFPHLGAIYWPADEQNHTVLATEAALPLSDNSVERMLICHSAEHSPHLSTLMNEVYRSLKSGGRALIIAPNRLGGWARNTHNPFGSGHPYQMSQMKHRAELAGLTYVRASTALFYPPYRWRLLLKCSRIIEWLGALLLPNFGGVLMVELEKQIYASIPEKGTPVAARLLYPNVKPAASATKQTSKNTHDTIS